MKRSCSLVVAALLAAAGVVYTAPAAHASTWTEIPSGTSATITAVEYQGANRFWFTTSQGGIFKRQPSGAFLQVRTDTSIPLNDIEFQDGGPIGLAVGDAGQVLRSEDNGNSWAPVTGIPVSKKQASSSFPDCSASEPLGSVNSVRFAGNNRVWIFAEGSQLARSQTAAPTDVGKTGTWVDANWVDLPPAGRSAGDECKADHSSSFYNTGLADGFFSPTNPDVGWVLQASFARVLGFTDDLASQATLKAGAAGVSDGGARVLTGDPANPQRMWSVNGTAYGASTMSWTEDGYTTTNRWNIVNSSYRQFPSFGPSDVDYRDGTVLAAGSSGLILASVNGRDFYYVDDAALPTQDWRAVGVASATDAAVGGTGGKLIITTNANAVAGTTSTTPPAPTTLGGSAKKPPLVGGAATTQGNLVVLAVKGKLGLPAGVAAANGCSGKVSISVYKGKKRLAAKKTKVSSKCRYKKTIHVKRAKVGSAKKLTLKIAFGGNAYLAPLSSTYKVNVR